MWKEIPVNGKGMSVYVAKPKDQPIRGSIIVLQEIWGVNNSIQKTADRLAEAGYAAWAPDVFHRSGQDRWIGDYEDMKVGIAKAKALEEGQVIEDMRKLFEQIALEDKKGVACTGFCLGGRLTYLLASHLPLRAGVCFYGGGIATGPNEGLIKETANIPCPMLLFYGGLDAHITQEQVSWVRESLKANHKQFEIVVYPDADHAFMNPDRMSYNPEAAGLGWMHLKEFLRQTLK